MVNCETFLYFLGPWTYMEAIECSFESTRLDGEETLLDPDHRSALRYQISTVEIQGQ
jgi:hypothetical protein